MISENSSRVLGFSIVPERVAESVSRLCPRFCQSLISQLWPRAPNLPSSAAIMEIQVCTVKQRLPRWYSDKEFACQCRRCIFDPWVGKIPWRRAWQPTPVLLPGESHRQRSLAGYSPWGRKELDMTERLSIACHSNILSILNIVREIDYMSITNGPLVNIEMNFIVGNLPFHTLPKIDFMIS